MIKAILKALDIVSDNFLSQISGHSIPRFSQALIALFVSLFALFLSLLRAFLNLLAFRAFLLSVFDGSMVPKSVAFSLLLLLTVSCQPRYRHFHVSFVETLKNQLSIHDYAKF